MQTSLNPVTPGLLLALVTLLPSARPALGDEQISFTGKEVFVSSTPVSFVFPLSTTEVEAKGKLTHFGHYTLSGVTVINVLQATATGTSTMTFEDGDQLFLTLTGYAVQPFSLKETLAAYTVTGGTGRFQGASGGWTSDAHFVFPVNAGVSPNPYKAAISGQIELPECSEEDEE